MGGSGTLTEAGTVLGTASYISPEQAAGQPAGPASDVYSFGVILFRMLTGRLRSSRRTRWSSCACTATTRRRPLPTCAPDAPARLESIAHAALAKDPADRPADGGALLRELRGDGRRRDGALAPERRRSHCAATQVLAADAARPRRGSARCGSSRSLRPRSSAGSRSRSSRPAATCDTDDAADRAQPADRADRRLDETHDHRALDDGADDDRAHHHGRGDHRPATTSPMTTAPVTPPPTVLPTTPVAPPPTTTSRRRRPRRLRNDRILARAFAGNPVVAGIAISNVSPRRCLRSKPVSLLAAAIRKAICRPSAAG